MIRLVVGVLVSAWFCVSLPEEEPLDLRDLDGNLLPKKLADRRSREESSSVSTKTVLARPGCPEGMVYIPEGTFGGVILNGFCLDTDEVTVAKFDDYFRMLRSAEEPRMTKTKIRRLKASLATASAEATMQSGACTWHHKGSPLSPINCISVVEAEAYCRFYGKRLPSRREWRWAARGGERAWQYPWGRAKPSPERVRMALSSTEPDLRPVSVGGFPASLFGVRDLGGNVSEWNACGDLDRDCSSSGGNFRDKDEESFRVAKERERADRDTRGDTIGFRCASAPLRKRTRP